MKKHESQRGYFAHELYQQMISNNKIFLIVGDLGYKAFDQHFLDFPDRCINVGAAEQAMMDIAVGMAQDGKIPFVYSITPFLIFRSFETIRTYINHEKANVKLVGSGRDKCYKHDGISHWAEDIPDFMMQFDNIESMYPFDKEEVTKLVQHMVKSKKPMFISLER